MDALGGLRRIGTYLFDHKWDIAALSAPVVLGAAGHFVGSQHQYEGIVNVYQANGVEIAGKTYLYSLPVREMVSDAGSGTVIGSLVGIFVASGKYAYNMARNQNPEMFMKESDYQSQFETE
jgi:hypothetical protein